MTEQPNSEPKHTNLTLIVVALIGLVGAVLAAGITAGWFQHRESSPALVTGRPSTDPPVTPPVVVSTSPPKAAPSTPPRTASPAPSATIRVPSDKECVERTTNASGTARLLSDGSSYWLLVHSSTNAEVYLGPEVTPQRDGQWTAKLQIGDATDSTVRMVQLDLVRADAARTRDFRDRFRTNRPDLGSAPPSGIVPLDSVTVTRKLACGVSPTPSAR
jgi:hypothetical protein